jgi:hypothetical protein
MTTYNGTYGIVLLPASEGREEAVQLSRHIKPTTLDLGGKHHPHLTLYHANFDNLPEEVVDKMLQTIGMQLPLKAHFFRIATYKKKFVFWDARRDAALFSLHTQSLSLSEYLNEQATAVGTETLDLSEDEKDNIRRYGHPLVGSLWRPHITLAYREEGPEVEVPRSNDVWFAKVAFVLIGEYGTAQKIIDSRQG